MLSKKNIMVDGLLDDLSRLKKKLMVEGHIFFSECDIRPAQSNILRIICHHENIGIKDIANMMGVTKSAATQLVDELVAKGFVKKEGNKDDRRAVNLTLTTQATEKLKVIKKYKREKMSKLFDCLSEEEMKQFADICKKIIQ